MKKCIFAVVALTLLLGAHAHAQKPVVVLGPGLNSGRTPYYQNYDRVLSPDTVYTLTGLYYVDSLHTITIPAGTVVRGDTASTLIVSRGAKIYATGTAQDPVVFTSLKEPNNRYPGDWGGVIILGRAPVNKVEPQIEGGIIGGSYGGAVADDTSGVFKYVRIEFPGYRFQLNNEVNGLTMGGVGSGTELHHVQVSYSFDDSFEWFGGTVNAHHLVTFGGTDDEFDTDFGYQGNVQFCFGLRDRRFWDPTGQSNGFESDNDGSSTSTATPYTRPTFCNVTLIGPILYEGNNPPAGHSFQYSAVLRRSTKTSVFNSIIVGYPWGISLRDVYTHKWSWTDNELEVKNMSLGAAELKKEWTPTVMDSSRWVAGSVGTTDSCTMWFNRGTYYNYGSQVTRHCADIGLVYMNNINQPNPVPIVGSEPDGSADFSSPRLAGFTVVDYRGAFDPDLPLYEQWIWEWTNFNPEITEYNPAVTAVEETTPLVRKLSQNFPNPFNPVTRIKFNMPRTGHASLIVYNVKGEKVATLVNGEKVAGAHEVTFNAKGLASGTYFYTFKTAGVQETRKMVLLR
jgi:hypothetical protein